MHLNTILDTLDKNQNNSLKSHTLEESFDECPECTEELSNDNYCENCNINFGDNNARTSL